MRLFYQPNIDAGDTFLDTDESGHCVKALRLKQGDLIYVADGKGSIYTCRLTRPDPGKSFFEIVERKQEPAKTYFIHIAIAPTKNLDRLEWFVEKSVELGIDKISPILCRTSERKTLRTDRLQRKAISAMKQSLKSRTPEISEPIPFSDLLAHHAESEKYIAYLDDLPSPHLINLAKKDGQYLVLIGPEGDFSSEEVTNATRLGFQTVSLGNHRLRTETAGIAACHILNLINEASL